MQLSASLLPSLPVPPQRGGAVCQPAPQLWRPGSPCPLLSGALRSAAALTTAEPERVWEDEPIQGPVPHCHPSWKEGSSLSSFPTAGPGGRGNTCGGALFGVLGGAEEGAKEPSAHTAPREQPPRPGPDSTGLLPPPHSTLSPQEVIKM